MLNNMDNKKNTDIPNNIIIGVLAGIIFKNLAFGLVIYLILESIEDLKK